MVDSVQRASTVPLPSFQTEQGAHNPLPLDAPKERDRLEDASKLKAKDEGTERFEAYLDQSSITTLEKTPERSTNFDPAAEIAAASVYSQPGGKAPF